MSVVVSSVSFLILEVLIKKKKKSMYVTPPPPCVQYKQWHFTVILVCISFMPSYHGLFLICSLATWSVVWVRCSVVSPLGIHLFPWIWEQKPRLLIGGVPWGGIYWTQILCLAFLNLPLGHPAVLWASRPGLSWSSRYHFVLPSTFRIEVDWVERGNIFCHSFFNYS